MKHADEHLRRFAAARARQDVREMRRWWDELVIDFYDRIDGLVASVHQGRLDREEHEMAVSLALVKFGDNLVSTFEGSSIGELVNATRTLAFGVCVDVQRASMRRRRLAGPSLDEVREGLDGETAVQGWAEAEHAAWAHQRDGERRDAGEFVDWALERLGARQRRVIELTRDGAELPEIMQELGVSQANAYQLRSRALRAMRELKEQYDA